MATDIICAEEIVKHLDDSLKSKITIQVEECVTSTNKELKSMALFGEAEENHLLISRHQTEGRGRLGRTFFSPDGTGVYMSLLLKPACSPEEATLVTSAAAVAVCGAVEKISNKNPHIKWVNDIFIDGKKVCGILTETVFSSNYKTLDYVVLGVGVNMVHPKGGFPQEIIDIAGAIFEEEQNNASNVFIAEFLDEFYHFYKELTSRKHIQQYREKCFVLGKSINIISADKITPATALDVDENCNLVVQLESGEKAIIGTGEISIRGTW